MDDADEIWNRACMGRDPGQLAEADKALASMLTVHSVAMNGGLLHSVEHHGPEAVSAAVAGYDYFGLHAAGEVVAWVARKVEGVDLDLDDERAEAVELEADRRYGEVVPDDSTLVDAFERLFSQRPDLFAPLTK